MASQNSRGSTSLVWISCFMFLFLTALIFIAVPLHKDVPWSSVRIQQYTGQEKWVYYTLQGRSVCRAKTQTCELNYYEDIHNPTYCSRDTLDSCEDVSKSIIGLIQFTLVMMAVSFVIPFFSYAYKSSWLKICSIIGIHIFVISVIIFPIAAISAWEGKCHSLLQEDLDEYQDSRPLVRNVSLFYSFGWVLTLIAIVVTAISACLGVQVLKTVESRFGEQKPNTDPCQI